MVNSSATGDVFKNIETLRSQLRGLKAPLAMDEDMCLKLRQGDPSTCLDVLSYVLLEYSPFVRQQLLDGPGGEELKHVVPEARFGTAIFRAMRSELNYHAVLSSGQFFGPGFAERKVLICQDVVRRVKELHSKLKREAALQGANRLRFSARAFSSTRSPTMSSASTSPRLPGGGAAARRVPSCERGASTEPRGRPRWRETQSPRYAPVGGMVPPREIRSRRTIDGPGDDPTVSALKGRVGELEELVSRLLRDTKSAVEILERRSEFVESRLGIESPFAEAIQMEGLFAPQRPLAPLMAPPAHPAGGFPGRNQCLSVSFQGPMASQIRSHPDLLPVAPVPLPSPEPPSDAPRCPQDPPAGGGSVEQLLHNLQRSVASFGGGVPKQGTSPPDRRAFPGITGSPSIPPPVAAPRPPAPRRKTGLAALDTPAFGRSDGLLLGGKWIGAAGPSGVDSDENEEPRVAEALANTKLWFHEIERIRSRFQETNDQLQRGEL